MNLLYKAEAKESFRELISSDHAHKIGLYLLVINDILL